MLARCADGDDDIWAWHLRYSWGRP
jgi:hypothetical protein